MVTDLADRYWSGALGNSEVADRFPSWENVICRQQGASKRHAQTPRSSAISSNNVA
jgi:hypothetical protein